ncbi:uncharacterized protein YcnI [Paenibacillus phyllosphaerae]|uniref:Uncharacterized protein YcnI n=1 Tax=Paenibacillus phyllosphaerae TaxID=274593 RepID=A0A7W5FRJ2_9BACL|nr:YcnI family protein [Paenibacillus phyllosphaerae]MBB3114357.1 uncharacterized protein YcnI [Paenibacillus phyllosphaerae]
MMKRMKQWVVLGIALMSMMMFAGLASAHVTVWPKETTQNSYEVFTVRVPSESENVTTTSVQVRIPEGVNVSRVEPKGGWTYALEQAADGVITSVTWTAEGEGLKQVEFTEFRVSGKVAEDASELVWKAYQTYSDKSVVEWIGAADADYPASVTSVAAGTGEGDGHGHGAATTTDTAATDAATDAASEESSSNMPLILSIIAVALAAVSVVVSFVKKK